MIYIAEEPIEFEAGFEEAVPEYVEDAVHTLISWLGDEPGREGLLKTSARVAKASREICRGHLEDPASYLSSSFVESDDREEAILIKNIPFQSLCETHMAPISGKASIAYLPKARIVDATQIVAMLHCFAQRPQSQERLTSEVSDCIWTNLNPQGVAIVIEAYHSCMMGHAGQPLGDRLVTSRLIGQFKQCEASPQQILPLLRHN